MKTIKSCYYLILCNILFMPYQQVLGQGIRFIEDEPLGNILQLAKEKNAVIFLDGYTKVCPPCKELDSKVFPLKKVGDYFNANFINVKYDLERPEGKKVWAKYKDVINGFPSLLLLDKDGKMIHKMGGFHPADSLITKMKLAMNGANLCKMRLRLAAGEKSVAFVHEYMKILVDGLLREEAHEVSLKILDRLTDEEMLNAEMWQLVGRSVTDPYSPIFARVVKNYWNFWQKKSADLGVLEFQLRVSIQHATDDIVNLEERDNRMVIKTDKHKETLLLGYLGNNDLFKHTESIKAQFYIHEQAIDSNWSDMITALKFYGRIQALGNSSSFVKNYIQYLQQVCKDKKVLVEASLLLKSMPGNKLEFKPI